VDAFEVAGRGGLDADHFGKRNDIFVHLLLSG
jgi:hypothetical protein